MEQTVNFRLPSRSGINLSMGRYISLLVFSNGYIDHFKIKYNIYHNDVIKFNIKKGVIYVESRMTGKCHKTVYGPGHAKTYLMPYANNKGADQPAHPRSLISTFVVRCLDSMICILAISKVSRCFLVSVAEQAGLNLTWSKISEDMFSRGVAHIFDLYLFLTLQSFDLGKLRYIKYILIDQLNIKLD